MHEPPLPDESAGPIPAETGAPSIGASEVSSDGEPREVPDRREPRLTADRLRSAQGLVTFATVTACAGFVFAQLQPDLLLSDTTAAGGDMGAHVWAPAYLRDYLLPSGRVAGWTPDWYAGFPAMQFYMVIPMLAIALLSYVIPYGIAFKLVTVLGVVTLPVSCYAFGRLTRLPFPVPVFLAVGGTLFVFDRSFSIYGGNAASTLAGEFAFSISLSLAVLYLGVVGRGLREGSHRALAAGLLALAGLSHLIPAFFAILGTIVWFVVWAGRDVLEATGSLSPGRWWRVAEAQWARLWWLATMAPVAALLAAFWVLPFYAKSRYLNDMGWRKEENYTGFLFWRDHLSGGGLADYPTLSLVLAVALLGAVLAVSMRNRAGVFLVGTSIATAVAFVYVPQGRLWNTRVLPFYYLSLILLAAVGLGLLPSFLARVRLRRVVGAATAVVTLVLQAVILWQPRDLLSVHVGDTTLTGDVFWARLDPYFYVGVLLVTAVAAAELVAAPARGRRVWAWGLVALAVLLQVVMRAAPDLRAGRWLLAYAISVLGLIAVAAVIEIVEARRGGAERPEWLAPAVRVGASLLVIVGLWLYLALPLRSLGVLGTTDDSDGSYGLVGVDLASTTDDSFVNSWAQWNYAGYESTCRPEDGDECDHGEKPYFTEYAAVVETMSELGEELGCGRAMWEYNPELDRYGTPMALMLLPHWTDGCIGSMEGLYFEASTTTPYHFINQDELSESGSNAQRGMPYGAGAPTVTDFDRGVEHLRMLGVRYYLAYTDLMADYARDHPALTEVATAPSVCREDDCPPGIADPPDRWVIFELADSPLVESLDNEPVVLTGLGGGHTCETTPVEEDPRGRRCEGWLDPAIDWYMDEALWEVPMAEDGPDDWSRIPVEEWLETHDAPRTPVEPARIGDVDASRDRITFSVDEPGRPVLVKASYFPNWKASGAEGPYRVTPNLMVVVPTDTEVELYYGWVAVDLVAWLATAVGIVFLVVLARRPRVAIPDGPTAEWRRPSRPPTSDLGAPALTPGAEEVD